MTAIHIVQGTGLVARSERFVSWMQDPSFRVDLIVQEAAETAFQLLGAKVLETDFGCPPFAVVDLEEHRAFVFGAVRLATPSGVLDGSSSGTWIERSLDSVLALAVNVSQPPDVETNLLRGAVRGDGWAMDGADLSVFNSAPAMTDEESTTTLEPGAGAGSGALRSETLSSDDAVDPIDPVDLFGEADARIPNIRLDDGQQIAIRVGAYVGRKPTQNGLPDGYVSVAVRGEYVSRVHWELRVNDATIAVCDRSGRGVLVTEANGMTSQVGPDDELVLPMGPLRVDFADRWAHIDT